MSTETKVTHTPGPEVRRVETPSQWRVEPVFVAQSVGEPIHFSEYLLLPLSAPNPSRGLGPYRQLSKDQATANALLMTAAPDLLEALQAVLRIADRKTNEFDAALAAIAKAKGGAA